MTSVDRARDDGDADLLLGGRVSLRQSPAGYRAAIDPVLLASAVPAGFGDSVVDLGCGPGAAFLCLARRVDTCRIQGMDVDAPTIALANDNITTNEVSGRVSVGVGDVAALPRWLDPASADHVMMNPPFFDPATVTVSADQGRARSRVEAGADLAAWIGAAHTLLRPKGWLTMVHRADRVDAILAALAGRFGATELVPLWPHRGKPARRIIVRTRKAVRGPAQISPGLVLHRPDGKFTPTADAILRDAWSLDAAIEAEGAP